MGNFEIHGEGHVEIGRKSIVSKGSKVFFNKPGNVRIGDYVSIGEGVKIICSGGDVEIGDWSTLHDNCLVLSGKFVLIGEHCWFGQNSIIDGTGGLDIGNGVRVGMYSQIWSHVAAGEQIEGCTLIGENGVTIGDNVWLVGSCIVSSGVTIGERTVALIGSNITKSFDQNSTIAGIPASIKNGLSFYKAITLDEKWELLRSWLSEYEVAIQVIIEKHDDSLHVKECLPSENLVIFAKYTLQAKELRKKFHHATVCCVEDKTYNKKFTQLEGSVLKLLSGNKARFYSLPLVSMNNTSDI